MKIFPGFLVAACALFLMGCSSTSYYEGKRLYNNYGYGKAIPVLEKSLAVKNIPDAKLKLADSYRQTNNSAKAEFWYSQVVTMPQAKPIDKLYYAQALIRNGKCSEAIIWLENYQKENPADPRSELFINSCKHAEMFYRDSADYKISKLPIEQFGSDFSPAFYKDGMVFVSERNKLSADKNSDYTGRPFLDLYYMKKDGYNNFSEPQPLKGEVNSKYHEGPVAFNHEGSIMYFTRNNYYNNKVIRDAEDVVRLKIYKAALINEEWKHVETLNINGDNFSTGHPALSRDGMTMYFVSDRPNGVGGTDIYMSRMDGGKWSDPANMGAIINTPGNEMFPFMLNDTTLIFSSDGRPGLGGLDVYSSYYSGGTWSDPENIGYPINSTKDDFGMIADSTGKLGYFSSNRVGDGTTDHIYQYVKGDTKISLEGIVVDKLTKKPLEGATVELLVKDTQEKQTVKSGPDGSFKFKLDPMFKYKLITTKDGYLTDITDVPTAGKQAGDKVKMTIELDKVEVGQSYVLENIYYDYDKWNIRADAAVELDKLVEFLNNNKKIRIELSSHTDSRGSNQYNEKLSQRRAESVVNYLISRGIESYRMIAQGYGEYKLVNKCTNGVRCSEAMHQANRRTEFKIISLDK